MPTLSLMPIQTGSPPDTEAARANGGTEGREGTIAAGTKSGTTENTWTRLFQSIIKQGLTPAAGASISTAKAGELKSQTADSNSSVATPPITDQSTPTLDLSTQALTLNAVAPAPAVQIGALGQVVTTASKAGPAPVQTASALTAPPIAVSSLIAKQAPPAVGDVVVSTPKTISIKNASERKSATVVSNAAVSTAVSTAPLAVPSVLDQVPQVIANAVSSPVQVFQLPQVIEAKSVTTVATTATAATTATQTAVPTAAAPTNPADTTIALSPQPAPVPTQTAVLPQNLPTEAVAALAASQVGSVQLKGTVTVSPPLTGSSITTPPKSTSVGTMKGSMERSQVLGDQAEAKGGAVRSNSGSASESTSDGQSDRGSSGDSSAGQSSFAGLLATAAAVTTSATATPATTNAALILDSSHAERMQVVSQISSHIQSMQPSTANPNTMTVTIQPPHWGEVKIAVTLNPDSTDGAASRSVSATVTASTSEVQNVLQQHVQELKDSLASAGMHLDKMDIGVGTVAAMSESGGSTGHHAGQQDSNQNQAAYQNATADFTTNSGGFGGSFQSSSGSGNGEYASSGGIDSIDTTNAAPPSITSSAGNSGSNSHIDMRA